MGICMAIRIVMVGCGLGGVTASWALGGVKGPTSRPPSVWVKGGQAI